MVSDESTFIEGVYGPRVEVRGVWSDALETAVRQAGIVEVELNDGKGWRGNSVEFLARLPHLKAITIIDLAIKSVAPIHNLHDLRTLELITYCDTAVDFRAFPQLENCRFEWRQGSASLFGCTSIRSLSLNCFDGESVDPLGEMTELCALTLLNAPVRTIHGLRALRKLRHLRLGNLTHLTSLSGIETLTELEELEVHTCPRISTIGPIGLLKNLRTLYLNNNGRIESLKPLDNLHGLEALIFYESTDIVDGDLSPLMRQPHLRRVSFKDRPHYSHKRREFTTR